MNFFNPMEITANYAAMGAKKASQPAWKLLVLGIFAGAMIAFGSAVANTATYALDNVSMIRLVSGLLFPFGLAIIILIGGELFTGNCMISISVLNGATSFTKMLRNWLLVYIGNLIGSLLLGAGIAYFGQLDYSSGALAVYTIKLAAHKCEISFASAVVMGIFCNILVCLGVLVSQSAKDTAGRIMGAYIPVAFFVICGFEHCVANMYYISTGLFAMSVPQYAAKALEAGINMESLTWTGFFMRNLLPVTIGNIIGGVAIGAMMWACHLKKSVSAIMACNSAEKSVSQ